MLGCTPWSLRITSSSNALALLPSCGVALRTRPQAPRIVLATALPPPSPSPPPHFQAAPSSPFILCPCAPLLKSAC
jgi:hypothetical protein